MNTKWNFFAEIEGSSNNNYRDVATSQALGNILISFSFQNWENRENLTSQILKNFPLVQTLPMFEPVGNFSKPVFSVFLSRLRILRALKFFPRLNSVIWLQNGQFFHVALISSIIFIFAIAAFTKVGTANF